MQIRGVWDAQILDVHPQDYQVSVVLRNLAFMNGIRVSLGGTRQHPVAGDYQLPEVGDQGLVAFANDDPRSGTWLLSRSDLHRHLIPTELFKDDPFARLHHRPSDRYSIEHGDGSEEHVWPDGTFLKLTTRKDGSAGNTTERAHLTDRYRSTTAAPGQPETRESFVGQERPPTDILLQHASGALVLITADGSFHMTTPKGHTLRMHDATEKARSAEDGSVTGTPEEDDGRVRSELALETEMGHQIILHDDPEGQEQARYLVVRHALGHELRMFEDTNVETDVYMHLKTALGNLIELRDRPVAKVTVKTAAGRTVTMDDGTAQTRVHDPALIVLDAPMVKLAGDASVLGVAHEGSRADGWLGPSFITVGAAGGSQKVKVL